MHIDWNAQLLDQLQWHWRHQARPRLDGLSDHEYFWEPAPGCWNLRPRAETAVPAAGGHAHIALQYAGSGDYLMEYAHPAPDPAPVTTIAWRLAHLSTEVLGKRSASHFGGPPADGGSFRYAGTAGQALFADYPLASLVLHINREVIHHLAEVALLRDLYQMREAAGDGP